MAHFMVSKMGNDVVRAAMDVTTVTGSAFVEQQFARGDEFQARMSPFEFADVASLSSGAPFKLSGNVTVQFSVSGIRGNYGPSS